MAKTATTKSRTKWFKANLRSLIARAGLTQREFADKLDLPYNWIRKSCNDGIARLHPNNEKSLRSICDFFGLGQIDSLWQKRIPFTDWKADDLAEHHREFVDDFNWLLKEFPDNHNVAEVKRVIGEVVEYIRRPASQQQDATEERPDRELRAATTPRAERFRANLRHLIEEAGLTQKAFAVRISISYIWLRKSCTNGVARVHPKNEKYIQAICDFFDLRNLESLWNGRLTTKRFQSIDDLAETQRILVSDLIWLLKEHGDSQDLKVRSHVSEVKRVIADVVKHLYVPKAKAAHAPEPQRPQRTWAEITEDIDKLLAAPSTFQEPLQERPVYSTPTRHMRSAEVNRKGMSYFDDMRYLDDQLDGVEESDDDDSQESEDYGFENFQAELASYPATELIEANNRLSNFVSAFIECVPESLKTSFSEDELRSTVAKLMFRQTPLDEILEHLNAKRWVAEFIADLPKSVKSAFEETKLPNIVESLMVKGVSPEVLRRNLDKVASEMGIVDDPEIIKRKKRIRRRRIPLH